MNALQMFRAGHDYIEIAAHFGTSEAVIERVIHRLRTAERLEDRAKAASVKQEAINLLNRKVRDARTRDDLREIRARRNA